ncbi:hypothetical protein ACFE04_020974 [Oxalis oulophora]
MAFLFRKFQEAVQTLAKSSTFAKNPRQLQYEADVNRLFLYSSYNRLGRDADEADADEIIDMATKASLADQQKQVHENIHSQVKSFCKSMDEILLPHMSQTTESTTSPRPSGLSFAVGRSNPPTERPGELSCSDTAVPEVKPVKKRDLSQQIKELLGYTLDLKASEISHKDAGTGLFLDGEAQVGSVIAFYPGVVYSPAYYRYIPGYPRVDAQNPYLITRYDGTVINAQPWGTGGETRELWDGSTLPEIKGSTEAVEKGSDRVWKMLSKPLQNTRGGFAEVLEQRNPLAFGHFANHPAKDVVPNVMICPYDFPLNEKDMRTYVPNLPFGGVEEVQMKKFGSFWFKWGAKKDGSHVPVLKTLVLVATRALLNEEVLLNYRLSNAKRRPSWYTPVDEEEDKRRWS